MGVLPPLLLQGSFRWDFPPVSSACPSLALHQPSPPGENLLVGLDVELTLRYSSRDFETVQLFLVISAPHFCSLGLLLPRRPFWDVWASVFIHTLILVSRLFYENSASLSFYHASFPGEQTLPKLGPWRKFMMITAGLPRL